jgi:DNA-binding YbaB/EbfC family protein
LARTAPPTTSTTIFDSAANAEPELRNAMADFMGMMKQAAQLQQKMQALQAELEQLTVEGSAGGGVVVVRLSGKGELKGVTIDPSLMKPEEKEIVEDLLVAAYADARRKTDGLLQDKMKQLTGGLPLPPGLKLF